MSFVTSDTGICNMALAHIGVGKPIGNLETDASREAQACRVFFETARDEVLRDFSWPFCTRIVTLGLVEETPDEEWAYTYAWPSDAVGFRRIPSGIRNDNRQTRVPYRIIHHETYGKVIRTDMQDAKGEYTFRNEGVEDYPPDFKILVSYKLAGYIVPLLSAGDPFKIGDSMVVKYQIKRAETMAAARNEEQPDQIPEAESIRAREGESFPQTGAFLNNIAPDTE